MTQSKDSRLPVLIGPTAGPGDVLVIWPASDARHRFGCACCGSRSAIARALAQLFLARARGEVAWFSRVVVDCPPEAAATLAAALAADPVCAARLRFAGAPLPP